MDAELFQDAAAVRIGGLVADSQARGGFLGRPAFRNQDQNLPFALRQCEYQVDRFRVGREHIAPAVGDVECGAIKPVNSPSSSKCGAPLSSSQQYSPSLLWIRYCIRKGWRAANAF